MTAYPHLPVADIAEKYNRYRWPELDKPHLTTIDIAPVIHKLSAHPDLQVRQIGRSYEGRRIQRLTVGNGPLVILAWTQMHGDEPTATAAVLDWLAILLNDLPSELPADWQQHVTLHIIPMLNPDGAQQCTRVNAQGIDINRDAQMLQTPEGRLLNEQVDSLTPDIAFNLHDQNAYYTTGASPNPATIAFLAPAYHQDKHVDGPRLRAKQLIATMTEALRHDIPDCIGRYDDTYSFRSFGDNIAASGASTILIESGAAVDDPNRQIARKMNVLALQTALASLFTGTYRHYSLADYYRIPENREDGLCDVKIHHVSLGEDAPFYADISVKVNRKTGDSRIDAIGDLRTVYGFEDIDGTEMMVLPPQGFIVDSRLLLDDITYAEILAEGYSYFIDESNLLSVVTSYPALVVDSDADAPRLFPEQPAWFLLAEEDSETPVGAMLNGQWLAL